MKTCYYLILIRVNLFLSQVISEKLFIPRNYKLYFEISEFAYSYKINITSFLNLSYYFE